TASSGVSLDVLQDGCQVPLSHGQGGGRRSVRVRAGMAQRARGEGGRDQRALWVLVQQVQPLVGVLGVRVRVRVRVRGRGRREREVQRLRLCVELIAGQRFGENRYGRLFGDRLDGVAAGGRLFAVHQPPDTRDVGERVTVLGALSGRH